MEQAEWEDAIREDILTAVRKVAEIGLSPGMRAHDLARATVGVEAYGEWREQSYDCPTIEEHVDLALVEGPLDHAELAFKQFGIDYEVEYYRALDRSLE